MSFYNPFDDPKYCGYCKCSPCQCDGHGNFGPVEPASLPEIMQDEEIEPEEAPETPLTKAQLFRNALTYEDGTPYESTYERQRRPGRRTSYRPQRPKF